MKTPTILATSGGYVPGTRVRAEFGPLVKYALELAGAGGTGRTPKLGYLATACGDQLSQIAEREDAGRLAGIEVNPLRLFVMPNVEDIEGFLMEQDAIWVDGGSVENLLAVWRVHRLDAIFRRVWEAGVVLAGVSAGSICWHRGGTTDSFGPTLRPVTDGLGLIPYDNGVHYDAEEQRRPLVHRLVTEGTLGRTYCTDNGVGLVYRGSELAECVAEVPERSAYVVENAGGEAVEEALPTRLLQ
ncbi:MAG: peptidase E [Mobiluncus sp.]|uniref:Type 1 glutamine amidotransferase-like domain-containing protein n=1 Tax=Mobiluncus sp. TaxID=47293 RepID=UPI0025864295|nr:peptidase E [Mobiluncus sp.]MCI6584823.1 peptidase E [Mobiluncus sp.]